MWAWENRLGTVKRPRHKMIAELGRAERMKSYCASISDAGGREGVLVAVRRGGCGWVMPSTQKYFVMNLLQLQLKCPAANTEDCRKKNGLF